MNKKRLISMLCIVTLLVCGLYYSPSKSAKAEESKYTILVNNLEGVTDSIPEAYAGVPVTYQFSVSKLEPLYLLVYTYATCDVEVSLYSHASGKTTNLTVAADDTTYWQAVQKDGTTIYELGLSMKCAVVGSYDISLTFSQDSYFGLMLAQQNETTQVVLPTVKPVMSRSSLTLTKGFQGKLSVANAGGKISWTSSKPSVVKVSKTGTLSAKKAGKSTITATTPNGKVTCKVTVKENTFSRKARNVAEVPGGKMGVDIYKMSYDKKGNLVMKAKLLNNTYYACHYLKNLKIRVKNKNGKTIGTFKASKIKNVNLGDGFSKKITFTIKKSKLSIKKKQDLRLSTVKVLSGQSISVERTFR